MITFSIGRRKRGKSTLAYAISLRDENRVIFDPRRQFHTTDDIIPNDSALFDLLETRSEIIVQPPEGLQEVFERVCADVFDFSEEYDEKICFIIDECRFLDLPSREYPSLERLLRFADPNKVDTIFTCHRPVDLSVDIRAIGDYWCIFQTTQEHDLAIISERCGIVCADACRNLKRHEYVLWDDTEGVFAVKHDSASWYIPIERKAEVHVNA